MRMGAVRSLMQSEITQHVKEKKTAEDAIQ